MQSSILSSDLISLVQFVELNREGWWDKSVRKLILAVVHGSRTGIRTVAAIRDAFKSELRVDIQLERLRPNVDHLVRQNELVILPNGNYKVSEARQQSIQKDSAIFASNETSVKTLFSGALASKGLTSKESDNYWQAFLSTFLVPHIKSVGADAYNLISKKRQDVEHGPILFKEFLERMPENHRAAIRIAANAALDPSNAESRAFVLGYLNAYFFLEATALSKNTLRQLTVASNQRAEFNVLLDTNFVFSILDLHDNPSTEAAKSLLETRAIISEFADVNMLVHPLTLREARFAMNAAKKKVPALNRVVAEVALDQAIPSGLVKQYAIAASKSKQLLTSEKYFEPYDSQLEDILARKGVTVVDQSSSPTSDAGIDEDIETLQDQQARRDNGRQKNAVQIEHDVRLWHFAFSKRPRSFSSPLEAKYWIASIDFDLMRFDERKSRNNPDPVKIVLHPTELLQLLQFWIPRSSTFEEMLVANLSSPWINRSGA